MKEAIVHQVPLIISIIGIYCFAGFISLFVFRAVLIAILKRHGKFESMGSPAVLNLANLLPVRMYMMGSYMSASEKYTVKLYLILFASVLLALVVTVGFILVYRT